MDLSTIMKSNVFIYLFFLNGAPKSECAPFREDYVNISV